MEAKRRVVITGLGLLTPIGNSVDEVMASLIEGTSGIKALNVPPLEKKFPVGIVGYSFENTFSKLELPYLDRCQQLAIVAARQALEDANLGPDLSSYQQRAGLYYGTVKGGAKTEQDWYQQLLLEHKQSPKPYTVMAVMHNAGAAQISIRHKILGPVSTHGSACTSSGAAIGEAMRAIRDGYLDVAIAGGADSPLTSYMLGLFDGTRALAPIDNADVGKSCRPFSSNRSGLVLGEGAAFLVLESEEHARQRGAACYARLDGYGIASDAFHVGQPHADGQSRAIRDALSDAQFAPEDVQYFNAHATATRGGDEVETNAIRNAFGEAVSSLRVSSTKSLHGHLLGAASALELAITSIALTNSFLPATAHLDAADPACALNHVANKAILNQRLDKAMSFSCGFGGTNVALAISNHREMPMKRRSTTGGV